ncbi:6,7-dimethyl-8-ribityllumazine synthase [Candidatus Uhrbacteria bacterium]|nr:6,7-dimethyl-8-ribityllumazine synthase [Candidatus Uhrbacteria bacterium]
MSIRVHLVAGYIHKDICETMIDAARSIEDQLDCRIDRVVWIPGSLEAPLAVKELIERDRPDAMVIFGIQEQGATKHGEVIAHQATSKLLDLQLQYRMPMAIAIIGPGATLEHAKEKAARTAQKALRAAVHMVKLTHDFGTEPLV